MSDSIATKTVIFPVGDYAERLDRLYAAAQLAREDDDVRMLNEDDPYLELRSEYEALKAESEKASRDAGLVFVLSELTRSQWRKLKADHPPRTEGTEEDIEADRAAGFNLEAGEDDLLFAAIKSPQMDSRAAFDEWADSLGAGKFAALSVAAFRLIVDAQAANPKSLPASPMRSAAKR